MLKYINSKKVTATILLAALSVGLTSIKSTIASDPTPNEITLTGTIRDFKADDEGGGHPDFEYKIANDRGIVTNTLGADKKPVYGNHTGGKTTTTNGKQYFDQWYRDVPGVNKSIEHSITLTKQSDGTYRYTTNNFFPINGKLWGNYKNTGKNFHFTYELHTSFTYQPGQQFKFTGDDDVWVYINGKRVIDLGGVHSAQNQEVNLDTLGLTVGETYDLDFFFAERHTTQSNFTITTSIKLEPPKNNAPNAVNDTAQVYVGQSININPLVNDTDSDGDTLTVSNIGTPTGGTATLTNGRVVYTAPNTPGTRTLNYTISDGKGGTDTATITILVKNYAD